MPVKAESRISAWSYSRLKDWTKCAFYACLKHVRKMKEPGSKAMDEGSYVDFLAEVFATKNLTKTLPRELTSFAARYTAALKLMKSGKTPSELARFADVFEELRKHSKTLHVQEQIALDKNWSDLGPDGWFSPEAWVRVKMDLFWDDGDLREIIDWKNGQIRGEDLDQLDLYALAAFAMAPPSIRRVRTRLAYLQAGEFVPEEGRIYTRDEVPRLKASWAKRVKPMLADTKFRTQPAAHCNWCWFGQKARATKGGPGLCKY